MNGYRGGVIGDLERYDFISERGGSVDSVLPQSSEIISFWTRTGREIIGFITHWGYDSLGTMYYNFFLWNGHDLSHGNQISTLPSWYQFNSSIVALHGVTYTNIPVST